MTPRATGRSAHRIAEEGLRPRTVVVDAPAKINLRLLVGPLGADGYHPLRSLMVALDGPVDTVTVTRSAARWVECAGVPERDNLAWRALDALERHVGRPLPCRVVIEKRIPAQAGLGGGSSDAAATLVGANELHGLVLGPGALEAIGADVGSDVPFFVRGGTQWATGRGERLAPAAVPAFAAVIVKPAAGLATPDVYRAFDALPAPPPDDGVPVPGDAAGLAGWVRNDLWPAALACLPELARVAGDMAAAGAGGVLLCGSGTAIAGLFPDTAAADRAAGRLRDVVAVSRPAPPRERPVAAG